MNTDFKIVESILFYLESEIDVTSIIIGVVATLICRVATVQLQILQHKWKERLQFNLSGIWTCQFDSFVYDARSIIEIYNIVQKKDNLDFCRNIIVKIEREDSKHHHYMERGL